MSFQFPPLKLPNKGIEEYSKIIIFIHFHFIPFFTPKRIEWNKGIEWNKMLSLGVHKWMKWNGIEWSEGNQMIIREWKWMEWNGMYLSKGNELNEMELSNLYCMF